MFFEERGIRTADFNMWCLVLCVKHLLFLAAVFCWLISNPCLSVGIGDRERNTRPAVVNVGILLAFNSTIGRMAKTAIELALKDVNGNDSLLNGTKLALSVVDSDCNAFVGTVAALALMKKEVVAIVGPQISVLAHIVSHLGRGPMRLLQESMAWSVRSRGSKFSIASADVKAAVSIFGESVFRDPINGKKLKIPTKERKLVKESELHLVQKEFPKPEEQLQHLEPTVAQSQLEVERAKKMMEDLGKAKMSREMANHISELVKLWAERLQAANTHIIEVDNRDLQTQLNAAREQHMVVSAELGVAKQELKRVKEELATSVEAEALALKQAKYAKLAAEMDSIKLDELTKEIASANELFDLAKLAYEEAQRETTAIIAEEQAEAQKFAATTEQTSKQLEASRKELAAAEDLQSKASLIATTIETNNLLIDQISNPRHHLPFYTAIDSLNNFNFNFNSAPRLRETPRKCLHSDQIALYSLCINMVQFLDPNIF